MGEVTGMKLQLSAVSPATASLTSHVKVHLFVWLFKTYKLQIGHLDSFTYMMVIVKTQKSKTSHTESDSTL